MTGSQYPIAADADQPWLQAISSEGAMNTTSRSSVRVPIRYAASDKPPGVVYTLSQAESTSCFEAHDTEISNARLATELFSLDTSGFTLVKHSTRMTDINDQAQIDGVYTLEVQALVSALTGATRVHVFHKLARYEDGEKLDKRRPAASAHVDYTGDTYLTWARQELGEREGPKLLRGRWASINVWRGIGAVERMPLAVVDGRTVQDEHFLSVPIHNRPGDPTPLVGRNLMFNPSQRWYYFPAMQPDEVLLFTQYASDPARPQRVAHSAFDDPGSRADAAPRVSFECRTFAFFD
jgi:hypothetical protein